MYTYVSHLSTYFVRLFVCMYVSTHTQTKHSQKTSLASCASCFERCMSWSCPQFRKGQLTTANLLLLIVFEKFIERLRFPAPRVVSW